MRIGSDEWIARADKWAERGLCSYCGQHPINRKFPFGHGICVECDAKIDVGVNRCTASCVHYHEYAPIVARRIIEHCDHMGYKFTARDWHTHHNKLPLEQMVAMMLDEMARALKEQDDVINNILTDSQLDTRTKCGKTLRQYRTVVRRLLCADEGEEP